MARLIAADSGDFTDSAMWGVCDTTAAWVIDSEAGTLSITTSTSTHISPSATPGAITVDGVALKISSRAASPTGTFTVVLRNTTAGSDVTSVVVNVTNLPINGWCFFKFSGSQLLLAATNYAIRVTCSVNAEVVLMRSTASAQEFARLIRTTSIASPAAGDQMIISDELTGAGTKNDIEITMDNTASTVFGSTTYTESLEVGCGGILTWGTTASTNYLLTIAGNVHIHDTGTWNMGTSGTRMPSTSTAKLQFSVATNVDGGFTAFPGAIVNCYGNIVTSDNTLMTVSRGGYCTTAGTAVTGVVGQSFVGLTGTIVINNVSYTISSVTNATSLTLTGSAGTLSSPVAWTHAGTAATLTVASTSGWAANDTLGVAATSQTYTDCENPTILTVDSATQVTLTAALTKNHSGDSPTQAEVIHLTRNVKICGTSTTMQGFINIQTTSVVNLSYVEMFWLGSATANKRGIDITTSTGSCTIIGCTAHDFAVAATGFYLSSASNNNISITYTHTYNIVGGHLYIVATTGTNWIINYVISMFNGAGNTRIHFIEDLGGTYTNITVVGASNNGIFLAGGGAVGFGNGEMTGTFSNITCHSNLGNGLSLITMNGDNIYKGTLSNLKLWRNLTSGLIYYGYNVIIDTILAFGNSTNNVVHTSTVFGGVIRNGTFASDLVFNAGYGWNMSATTDLVFESCTFGVVSGIYKAHTTADIYSNTYTNKVTMRNCRLASTLEIWMQYQQSDGTCFTSEKHDQTAGLHKRWEKFGTAVIDTVTYRTASPAETLTPNEVTYGVTSGKFQSSPTQPVAIDNGQTATITVYVYKSAAYNGSQPRLIVKANPAVGITSDTVLATASGGTGSWLTLSGTTAAVTDDGALVFVVDCDGTAGTVTVDDWSVA